MKALFLLIITGLGYLLAYHTYGRFIAKKVFKINPQNLPPAKEFNDGLDFVPTKKSVIFGHHFTSIAGTGPIVGPAIGVIWGWLPALIWVFLGSIFMGAVHDFSALIISMRNQGQSISQITGKYINKNVRTMFFIIVFFALLIVLAIFGIVIAVVFARFPQAVLPIWCQIPLSMLLGYFIYKKNGNLKLFTFIAVLIMYFTIFLGHLLPLQMPTILSIPPTGIWTLILLLYAFWASILPVTKLLQPRDYLNAWQLIIAMGILVLGIVVAHFKLDLSIPAPMINPAPVGAPSIWPFLFITIACGAISGFHSLVGSGTSSKQVACENDAQFIGFGSMLTEGFLATLVIIAVTAGLGLAYTDQNGQLLSGLAAWQTHYHSWTASAGLGSKITAMVNGSSNIIAVLGIPKYLGIIVIGVFIASFAGTTLDSATRIQRYIISELLSDSKMSFMAHKWVATSIAVFSALFLAFSTGANGKGALLLWPLFGSINQLLAGIALLLATIYLKTNKSSKFWITLIPAIFLLIIAFWGMISNQISFFQANNSLLSALNITIIIIAFFIIQQSLPSLFRSDIDLKI
jgi:carbon starvation protein